MHYSSFFSSVWWGGLNEKERFVLVLVLHLRVFWSSGSPLPFFFSLFAIPLDFFSPSPFDGPSTLSTPLSLFLNVTWSSQNDLGPSRPLRRFSNPDTVRPFPLLIACAPSNFASGSLASERARLAPSFCEVDRLFPSSVWLLFRLLDQYRSYEVAPENLTSG